MDVKERTLSLFRVIQRSKRLNCTLLGSIHAVFIISVLGEKQFPVSQVPLRISTPKDLDLSQGP